MLLEFKRKAPRLEILAAVGGREEQRKRERHAVCKQPRGRKCRGDEEEG